MPFSVSLLRGVQDASPSSAWATLFGHAWDICARPLTDPERAPAEVTKRDAEIGAADLFLATAGWDLWHSYETVVPRTADMLASWWEARGPGRAVLVLDALSLREVPWLLQGAAERGYTVNSRVTGAEIPADTTPFAQALGFGSRSAIQNNAGAGKGRLTGAVTDATDLPWVDCAAQVASKPDCLLWHHWPDERLHELSVPGAGLPALTREVVDKLRSEAFWSLVHVLTTGRRLVITADHGYAASGQFPDTTDSAQAQYLKDRFKSGRAVLLAGLDSTEPGNWVPPLDLQLRTAQAEAALVLGRRKWRSQGGYPTLTHGGLSLLEVAVPFVELSRAGGA